MWCGEGVAEYKGRDKPEWLHLGAGAPGKPRGQEGG